MAFPINNLQGNIAAGFPTEQEAKEYESAIMAIAIGVMESLKKKKDEFTSTSEVEF